MSRSRKKNPYTSTTCCGARVGVMKKWKTGNNRIVRRLDGEIPNGGFYKKLINPWLAPNDGKHRWDEPKGYRK